MSNFDKKWSELSKKEKKAIKNNSQYQSKQGWQDAKAASLGYKDESDRKTKQNTQSASTNTTSSTNVTSGSSPAPLTNAERVEAFNQQADSFSENLKKGQDWGPTHTVKFGDDGFINMQNTTTHDQLFNRDKLFELGYSEGDRIYKGGQKGERFGTGLMGASGLQVQQSHISEHFIGGSSYNPQVARLLDSGQLKLNEKTGDWSSYNKQGDLIQSGKIDANRKRYGYTHESAGAVRDEFKYADHHYNSASNKNIKNQASEFTKQQRVRDAKTRKAEEIRSAAGYMPNFDGAWSNPKANEIYRETGGSKEFNPSAYANQGTQKNSKLQDQINKGYASMNFEFDPTRFIQGQ